VVGEGEGKMDGDAEELVRLVENCEKTR